MTSTPNDRLDSWKAIARYLGRSVRTVRRWEQRDGLPVHRLMHEAQASVFAYSQEIDEWRQARARAPSVRAAEDPPAEQRPASTQLQSDENERETAAIAVLPFSFAGPEPAQAWVADGLTEEMISGFSRLRELRVTSRTSCAALQGSERRSEDIARLLGVTYLLEGAVVGDGSRLRINVRLIDPQQDNRVWSQSFVGDMEQIFDIQEQIARSVVDAMQLQLAPAEQGTLGQPTVGDVSAWRKVVLARQTALRWRPDALEQARTLLSEALQITGENAAICATMGRVLLNYQEAGISTEKDLIGEARGWEARALAANPDHPETRILSGWLAHASGDLVGSINELEKALQADRDHPDALMLLAHSLLRTGQTVRARPVIERALAVDPLTPLTRCFPGYLDAMEGRFEAATGPYRDMLERDPGNPVARLFNVWIEFAAGHNEEAIALAAGYEESTASSAPAYLARQLVQAHHGNLKDFPMPESIRNAVEGSEMYARHAAEAWAMAGNAEMAARFLERAVDLGFINWPYLACHSPFISPLRENAALKPVLEKAERRWKAIPSD